MLSSCIIHFSTALSRKTSRQTIHLLHFPISSFVIIGFKIETNRVRDIHPSPGQLSYANQDIHLKSTHLKRLVVDRIVGISLNHGFPFALARLFG